MLSRQPLCPLVSKQYRFRRDSDRGTTSRFWPDRHRKDKPRVRLRRRRHGGNPQVSRTAARKRSRLWNEIQLIPQTKYAVYDGRRISDQLAAAERSAASLSFLRSSRMGFMFYGNPVLVVARFFIA
jgi:hypothetical protein